MNQFFKRKNFRIPFSATLFVIRAGQTALPTSLFLDSPFSTKPIYKSSHRLRPPRLFIFISSANTANGKTKIQRIIICYLQASAIRFLLTSSIYIPTCTLKTPAHKKRGKEEKRKRKKLPVLLPTAIIIYTFPLILQ